MMTIDKQTKKLWKDLEVFCNEIMKLDIIETNMCLLSAL